MANMKTVEVLKRLEEKYGSVLVNGEKYVFVTKPEVTMPHPKRPRQIFGAAVKSTDVLQYEDPYGSGKTTWVHGYQISVTPSAQQFEWNGFARNYIKGWEYEEKERKEKNEKVK